MGRIQQMLQDFNGQSKIVDWYRWAFPSDSWAADNINPGATFQDAYECLQVGFNFYAFLGASDSLVRERVFDALATLMGCDYEHIYNQWLNHGKRPLRGARIENMTGMRFHDSESIRQRFNRED